MKTYNIPAIILALPFLLPLTAASEKWTNKEGKSIQLELLEVTGTDAEKAGIFKMANGQKVTIKASTLSDEDAKRLAEWKPTTTETAKATLAGPSVFDDVLDGNLLKLDGKNLKKFTPDSKPSKYYVFYYTASWCGPCQAFTPSLVEFYNKNKNDNFEIVLITSDSETNAMEKYAESKKMPWPHLKESKVKSFEKKFDHAVNGIPSVIVCDLEGKIVSRNGRNLNELEKLVK